MLQAVRLILKIIPTFALKVGFATEAKVLELLGRDIDLIDPPRRAHDRNDRPHTCLARLTRGFPGGSRVNIGVAFQPNSHVGRIGTGTNAGRLFDDLWLAATRVFVTRLSTPLLTAASAPSPTSASRARAFEGSDHILHMTLRQ